MNKKIKDFLIGGSYVLIFLSCYLFVIGIVNIIIQSTRIREINPKNRILKTLMRYCVRLHEKNRLLQYKRRYISLYSSLLNSSK